MGGGGADERPAGESQAGGGTKGSIQSRPPPRRAPERPRACAPTTAGQCTGTESHQGEELARQLEGLLVIRGPHQPADATVNPVRRPPRPPGHPLCSRRRRLAPPPPQPAASHDQPPPSRAPHLTRHLAHSEVARRHLVGVVEQPRRPLLAGRPPLSRFRRAGELSHCTRPACPSISVHRVLCLSLTDPRHR